MKRNRKTFAQPEPMELRLLPTVNVVFNAGTGLLKLTGDSAGDNVDVEGKGPEGEVEVFVNGGKVNDFAGVKSIKANLGNGDDELDLAAIRITGNVTVNMGDGKDQFDVDDTVDLGVGPNGVVQIGGFVKANLGGDKNDFVDWDDGIRVGGSVTITGVADVDLNGDGTDITDDLEDIDIGGNLTIRYSGQEATNTLLELFIDNVNVQGSTLIDGSNRAERVELTNNVFAGSFTANLDDGNDELKIDRGATFKNKFNSAVFFRGGDDNDTLLRGVDNLFAQNPIVTGFETIV